MNNKKSDVCYQRFVRVENNFRDWFNQSPVKMTTRLKVFVILFLLNVIVVHGFSVIPTYTMIELIHNSELKKFSWKKCLRISIMRHILFQPSRLIHNTEWDIEWKQHLMNSIDRLSSSSLGLHMTWLTMSFHLELHDEKVLFHDTYIKSHILLLYVMWSDQRFNWCKVTATIHPIQQTFAVYSAFFHIIKYYSTNDFQSLIIIRQIGSLSSCARVERLKKSVNLTMNKFSAILVLCAAAVALV